MILLFTSAKPDRPLYTRDLLNVCCNHSGATVQFGYRRKWLPDDFNFRPDPPRLAGFRKWFSENFSGRGERGAAGALRPQYQKALIVFCESVEGMKSYQYYSTGITLYKYHPVRLARVVDIREEHHSITLVLALGQFFNYGTYDAAREEEFQAYIKNGGQYPESEPYRWVRLEDELRDSAGEGESEAPWRPTQRDFSSGSWMPLVEHTRKLKGLDGSIFFGVQQEGTFGGPPFHLFSSTPVGPRRQTYEVKGGSNYGVRLYLMEGSSAEFRVPELKIDPTVASVSGPFMRQRSSGMEADFEVAFKPSFQEEVRMLELRIPAEPGSSLKVQSPELQALVKIKVPRLKLFVAVFSLALGGIFAIISPGFVDELAKLMSDDPNHWLKQNRLMAFTLTKVLALLLLAVGTYLGFNKLPFKSS